MSITISPALLEHPKFIVDEDGNQTGVILDIATYTKLLQILEDIEDNRLIDATEGQERYSLEEVLEEEDRLRGL